MSTAPSFRPGRDPLGILFESVSSLTERIKDTLEAAFADVALHGEITNLARPKSGHIYFSLRDQTASIRAVMWKGDAQRLPFDLSDGLAVRVLGRLTLYAPRGDYQVVVRYLEPEGVALSSWHFASFTPGSRRRVFLIPAASGRCLSIRNGS